MANGAVLSAELSKIVLEQARDFPTGMTNIPAQCRRAQQPGRQPRLVVWILGFQAVGYVKGKADFVFKDQPPDQVTQGGRTFRYGPPVQEGSGNLLCRIVQPELVERKLYLLLRLLLLFFFALLDLDGKRLRSRHRLLRCAFNWGYSGL